MYGQIARVTAIVIAVIVSASSGNAASTDPKTDDQPVVIHKSDLTTPHGRDRAALLLRRAEERGQLRVIIGLGVAMGFEDEISPAQQESELQGLRRAQAAVALRARIPAAQITTFETVRYMSAFVAPAQLRRLLRDPEVLSIQEDIPIRLQAYDSIALVNAKTVWKTKGITGKGVVVAVLDSGAEYTHPMLSGKTVAGLCRSTSNTREGTKSLCPRGVSSSDEIDSGQNCTVAATCFHGTHVSSIAVGNSANLLRGVARDAQLISGQVFSFRKSTGELTAFFTDIDSALERVFQLRTTFTIAAVNLSLGTSRIYGEACDNSFPATADIINNLKKAGIATVAASGNGGSDTGISAPACIDEVIAVGSTTKSDSVSFFSNHYSLVDLMAPGSRIKAAGLGGRLVVASGTSMATPHVAGAFALLREARPSATVNEIHEALSDGVPVTRNSVTKPRIDCLKAVNFLENILPTSSAEAVGE